MKKFLYICKLAKKHNEQSCLTLKAMVLHALKSPQGHLHFFDCYVLGSMRVGTFKELSDYETDTLKRVLVILLDQCDDTYFAPLTNKEASGDISHIDIALINRLTAELTSRYLLSGF